MHTRRGRCGHVARCAWIAGVVAVALGAGSADAFAAESEVQRVEAIGIYGIRDSMRTKVIPRDEAISNARWEGVSRVALELIGESGPTAEEDEDPAFEDGAFEDGPAELPGDGQQAPAIDPPLELQGGDPALELQGGDPSLGAEVDPDDVRLDRMAPSDDEVALLSTVLGKDMLPYTRGFRIVEDQGELPVLFDDAPGVDTEYVVVVEVVVDVGRVAAALEEAGLVVATGPAPEEALTLELVGLARYEALEMVLAALRGPLGATRVSTLEFERERQLLAVEGPFGVEALATLLADFSDPRLVLEPIALDPIYGRLRVLAGWFPAPDEGESEDGPPVAAGGR